MSQDQRAEWLLDRLGSVGGSTVGDALAVLKRASKGKARGERAQASLNLMYELAAERITGQPAKRVNSLQWGVDHEDEGLAAYAFLTNAGIVRSPGVVRHRLLKFAHASPDALVGDDGGVEMKCPTSAVHLQTLLADAIPEEHVAQVLWNLACTERQWWDFISYDPRFPDGLQLFVKRLERDEEAIKAMEDEVAIFLVELDGTLELLAEKYGAWLTP